MSGPKLPVPPGVSVGNVSKVKQLMMTADPELLQALRSGRSVTICEDWVRCREMRIRLVRLMSLVIRYCLNPSVCFSTDNLLHRH